MWCPKIVANQFIQNIDLRRSPSLNKLEISRLGIEKTLSFIKFF